MNLFACISFMLLIAPSASASDFSSAKQRYQSSLPDKARYELCVLYLQENPDSSIHPGRANDAARINELSEKVFEEAASCNAVNSEELSALKKAYEIEYKQSQEYQILESVFYKASRISAQQKMKVEENCSLFFDSAFEARSTVEQQFLQNENDCVKNIQSSSDIPESARVESAVEPSGEAEIAQKSIEKKAKESLFAFPQLSESAKKPLVVIAIFAVLLAVYLLIAGLKAIQRTALDKYDLKMFKSFQFVMLLLGLFCLLAALASDGQQTHEQNIEDLTVGLSYFSVPFVIALFMNIRKSNLAFGIFYTVVQAIMSVLFVLIIGIVILIASSIIEKIKNYLNRPSY
jgi:hypothetical protein